jgi:phosphoribosyl 1,2-cyclic phosphate phosphodiesterase
LTVTFLGTGTSQGIPVIGCGCDVCKSMDFRDKRLRTSIHMDIDGRSIVVDSGPDFRCQMLREGIVKLDALIFTHEHKDHTAGMDDIRPFNFMQNADIPIYGIPQVINQLKAEFSYVFSETKYPGAPGVEVNEISNNPFEINGIPINPIQVFHHKLPVFGYRVRDFTYITDANYIPQKEMEKIRGTKVLVLNALQINAHISHFNLREALEMVDQIQPEQAYFTHISHRLGLSQAIENKLPPNVSLAFDGLKIHI